ncbi:bifunctional 3-(3-hydroxy-phenyl)propionate/3-hydroxycinnamic acid hydroxylase [Cryobacterium frigoriphilum]|uniref:Bifunctional 3-(3-hydroxy-phenyl)propionate/3-hydroxycinnamic acid hydroxylase n=1 Tax=Cryobacterium frigoriphilum TaxID=1259150 RepID=A0A4V3IRN0_9MICO|nr:bifunctional 3-(3-hydroxy-phenyl)propionate/3-hydroxycinnamic acid hydroxylase [Cryobacterium frigoriphilum]TFD52269.1 bifunctional 3-(3-hydroxy-phenyl)propionate/3-hydroxycinnamic acid hydroxylase [Cryobacterium frigoriphilum]
MTVTTTLDSDVIVIGAGPAGLALTHLLALRGVSVTLVEALPDIIDWPRAVGIDDESFRTLQTMGVIDEVLPHTTPNHIMRIVNGRGKVMIEIKPKTREFGWSRRNSFSQPDVDKLVWQELARYPHVTTHFGSWVDAVKEIDDHVEVTVTRADGSSHVLRSHYLVGADGGKSPTRKYIGTSFAGKSPSTRWVVVDVDNDPVGTPNVFLGGDPKRPYVSLALPHGVRRFEFMIFDDETDEQAQDEVFLRGLLQQFVPDPTTMNLVRTRVFTHHSRVAGTFRRGRVLIAGDAAHLMPVWQGQGYNSGMRDATNLAWKLAAVVHGDSGEALLDTYTQERKAHAQAMVDISTTFGKIVKPTNRIVAGLRDGAFATMNVFPSVKAYFAEMKFKPMPRYAAGAIVDVDSMVPGRASATLRSATVAILSANNHASPVGTQFIQPRVDGCGQRDVLLDDLIGPGWAVIAWAVNPETLFSDSELAALDRLGARLVSVRPTTQVDNEPPQHVNAFVVSDVTGELKTWFDARPTPVVFLRPDRFIGAAGVTGTASRNLAALLTAVHAQPSVVHEHKMTKENAHDFH